VFLGEALNEAFAVLRDASWQVTDHTNVERTILLTGHYVDRVDAFSFLIVRHQKIIAQHSSFVIAGLVPATHPSARTTMVRRNKSGDDRGEGHVLKKRPGSLPALIIRP
jgi:hypothetical protein